MNIKINLVYANGTPIYKVPSFSRNQARVFGGVFSDKTGDWFYPAYYPWHTRAIEDYRALYDNVELSKSAAKHYEAQDTYTDAKLDPDFPWVTTPDDYQIDATRHCVYNIRAGALMDCGLGKTKVIIDTIRYINWCHETGRHQHLVGAKRRPKVLCVVKSSVLYNWIEELEKHAGAGFFSAAVVDGYQPAKLADGTVRRNTKYDAIEGAADKDFLIVTYEQAATKDYADFIQRHFKYDTIVADEAHKLQTWSSRNTQTAIKLASTAARRIIATGTATLGDPRHLYGQFQFLAKHLANGSYYNFCKKYLKTSPHSDKIVLGYKNLNQLNSKVREYGKIVRIDGRINTKRRTITVGCDLSKKQKTEYNQIIGAGGSVHPDTKDWVEYEEAVVKIGKAHQVTGGFLRYSNEDPTLCDGCAFLDDCVDNGIKPYTSKCEVEKTSPPASLKEFPSPKLDVMMDKLEDVLEADDNAVIITYRFQQERRYIEAAMDKSGINYLSVQPTTSAKKQLEMANTFESDHSVRVYLAQISTLVGINLVRAKYIFFFSLSLDLKDYDQARGRNYRRTQKAAEIFEYIFYCRGTVEEMILEAIEMKSDIKELVLSRLDCTSCPEYSKRCRANGIKPWRAGCVLDKQVDKKTIQLVEAK